MIKIQVKDRLFRYIAVLLLFLATATITLGQEKVKLSGRVVDDAQDPIVFAIIKVKGQAAGTTTDLQGKYSLEFNSADTVIVSFSMMGYAGKEKVLTRPRGDLRLNITLQPQSFDMGEVTV